MVTAVRGISVVLSIMLLASCARQQTQITRQDLADAQATITSAKILGAQEVAPEVIAQAEHYYKQALDDFNQVPKGRLGAYISGKNALEASASEKAQMAKRQAERALYIIKAQEAHQTDDVYAGLQSQAETLKLQVERLEREKEHLRQQNTPKAVPAAAAMAPPTTAGCPSDSEALYNKAFYLFQTRQYDRARTTFDRHLQLYTDDLSDNALFWIGETYFMQAHYAQALDTFQAVLRDYPYSNKSADAYLSIGLCRNRMNQPEAARQIWKTVVETYPDSTAAEYAQKFLNMK